MKSIDVIVVVDNCSTDDSFSVLKQYTSKKIQVIQSEKNGMDMEIIVELHF